MSTKRVRYEINKQGRDLAPGYRWLCHVCREESTIWDYKLNCVADAREHVAELHGNGRPRTDSKSYRDGKNIGRGGNPLPEWAKDRPSVVAGWEEGNAMFTAAFADVPTRAEREELDGLASSNT